MTAADRPIGNYRSERHWGPLADRRDGGRASKSRISSDDNKDQDDNQHDQHNHRLPRPAPVLRGDPLALTSKPPLTSGWAGCTHWPSLGRHSPTHVYLPDVREVSSHHSETPHGYYGYTLMPGRLAQPVRWELSRALAGLLTALRNLFLDSAAQH